MEIKKANLDDLTPVVLEDIEKLFNEGFEKEQVPRKFSWKAFRSFWELAFMFPWNSLWLLTEENDEDGQEHVYGLIGGTSFPNMLTDDRIAFENCWRTSSEVKGKGLGWDLLTTFIEWAINEQKATRIMTHRFLSNDSEADKRFDTKIREMGFSPSGCEYYMNV